MPRLPTSLILKAYNTSPLLALLLRPCRDLQSARNELRWLREHAIALAQSKSRPPGTGWRVQLRRLCEERGRGKPLQYILGNQPFGDVDILCRPGVLIPRPETESYTTALANTILSHRRQTPYWPRIGDPNTITTTATPIRILDLCTGTGCIPLLLHSLISPHPQISALKILSIDISPTAIALARANLHHNIKSNNLLPSAREEVRFERADILAPSHNTDSQTSRGMRTLEQVLSVQEDGEWDILISNPPYISAQSFNRDTARSVRNFEPRLALVPSSASRPNTISFTSTATSDRDEEQGDIFYPPLLSIAQSVNARILVMEVADLAQAKRVAALASAMEWEGIEIWRDWIDTCAKDAVGVGGNGGMREMADVGSGEIVEVGGRKIPVQGEGNGRAVVCWRGCALS